MNPAASSSTTPYKASLHTYEFLFYGIWAALIAYLGSVFIYENNGSFLVKGTSQWLDTPVHIAYIKHFINTPALEWFTTHPLNIQQEFTYHFFADLISAGMIQLGFDMHWSLALPVMLATMGFLREGYLYFKDESGNSTTSMLVVSSVFLFGGAGFLYRLYNPELFIQNLNETSVFATEGKWAISAFPNILSGMLFAQRGLPFGLWFFFLALRCYRNLDQKSRQLPILLGLNALMMVSLIHASMALHIFLGLCFLYKPSKKLFILNAALFIESLVIFLFFYTSTLGHSFVDFLPGFYFGFSNTLPHYLSFWLASTFALIPLIVYIFARTRLINIRLVFALTILLIINIIQFQPNPWDNVKLFVLALPFLYEYIFSGITKLRATHRSQKIHTLIAAGLLWPTGAWDIYETTFTERMDFELYRDADVQLAKELDTILPKGSTVVIEDKHNHMAIQLLNRHPLLGFQFNLDTYGHDYRELKNHINQSIEGRPDPDFVRQYNVSAIILTKGNLYDSREAIKIYIYIENSDVLRKNIEKLRSNHYVIAENDRYIVFSTQTRTSNE